MLEVSSFPGDVIGSTLVSTIESGNMPRGGGKVSPENLEKLKLWIEQGAKFDGPSQQAQLSTYVDRPMNANAANNPAPETMLSKPTGKETVSFSRQVAPLLIENCKGCHFNAQNASGRLRFDNFTQLLAGGDSGSLLSPGKGEESLLVKNCEALRASVCQLAVVLPCLTKTSNLFPLGSTRGNL